MKKGTEYRSDTEEILPECNSAGGFALSAPIPTSLKAGFRRANPS